MSGAVGERVAIESILGRLSQDVRDFELGNSVDILDGAPTSETFLWAYVSKNRPCVFRGAVEWPALTDWTLDSLCDKIGHQKVTCTVTPDGRADCVKVREDGTPCFALPHSQTMALLEFQNLLKDSRNTSGYVPSIQFQNSNLTDEFPDVVKDVGRDLDWASDAFGGQPEAVNIWIGDKRCSTSFHKDHYENMYTVITGTKTFTLMPPSSVHRMHLKCYPIFKHCQKDDKSLPLEVEDPPGQVQWCPIDVDAMDGSTDALEEQKRLFPRFFTDPEAMKVTLHAGETLYLPSMWYHYVQQDELDGDAVIAVNHWYDMAFDSRFAYFQCVERIAEQIGLIEEAPKIQEADHLSDD